MVTIAEIPKYEAYKDSGIAWLGSIPTHWDIKSLKRVVKEHSGNGFPIELQGQAGDIPFLKVSDLSNSGILIENSANKVSFKIAKKQKWNLVPAGSLVTAKIGEALRKNHRKILAHKSIIDNNCIAFECKAIEKKYNFYLHLVLDFDWFVNPGAVPSISVSKYKSQKIAVPSFEEQTLIANFLDIKTAQIDEAIAIKQQQISLLKERKQIIVQQVVTQGLDPNVPMKDSGVDWIGTIPEHWEVHANRTLFTERVESGREGLPLLSVSIHSGVSSEEVSEEDNVRGRVKIEDKTKYVLVKKGDVAFNMMRAWQGGIGAVTTEGMVSPAYIVAKPIGAIVADFFEYQYRCPKFIQQMDRYSKGITDFRKRLYWDGFKQLKTVVPPEKEQEKIIQFIQDLTTKTEAADKLLNAQIEKLKEYKTTLINSAVTGKIKITQEMVEQ